MSKKRKIGIIIGTRPQFVKLFPLINECNTRTDEIIYFIIHTGQHFDPEMSETFFQESNITKIHYNLDIHSVPEGILLGRSIHGIMPILKKEKPDMVVVFGDSHSTLSGAMAAKYCGFSCTHIEAGLRSFDMSMPEEINRIVVDSICDVLCCPTQTALNNLLLSGSKQAVLTGDIMLDAFTSSPTIKPKIDLGKYILFTAHRRKLMEDIKLFSSVFKAINHINNNICKVVAPLHPNCLTKLNQYNLTADFVTIPPQPYMEMKSLIMNSQLVITDSGGLQKEAHFAGKRCITLRENTEWLETLDNDCNVLVGYNYDKIIERTLKGMTSPRPLDVDISKFGDGKSAGKIISVMMDYINDQ